MKTAGIKTMPETIITAHCMQRELYREIIKAYHGTGSKQLSENKRHLQRPITALPQFNDRSIEEVTAAVFEHQSYQNIDDIPIEGQVPSETVHDPNEVEANEIIRQSEWYHEDVNNRIVFNHQTRSFLVADYLRDLPTQAYSVKFDSCTCQRGQADAPCVHWYVTRELAWNIPVPKEELVQKLAAYNKSLEKKIKKRPRDLGGKTPSAASLLDKAYPTITKKRGKHAVTVQAIEAKSKGTAKPSMTSSGAPSTFHEDQNDSPMVTVHPPNDGGAYLVFKMEPLSQPTSQENPPMEVEEKTQRKKFVTFAGEPVIQEYEFAHDDDLMEVVHDSHHTDELQESEPMDDMEEIDAINIIQGTQASDTSEREQQTEEFIGLDIDNVTNLDSSMIKWKIEPQECRFLLKNEQMLGLVKADDNLNGLLVFKKGETNLGPMKFMAAKLVRNGRQHNEKDNTSFVYLKEKAVATDKFDQECATIANTMKTSVGNIKARIQMDCICEKPNVNGVSTKDPLDLQCKDCTQKFHSKCFKDSSLFKPDDQSFTCPPCTLSTVTKGVLWSEKNSRGECINNTCPIDGMLTQMVLHESMHSTRLSQFFPNDERHGALTQAIEHLKNNDSHHAQKVMYDMFSKENDKIKGSEEYKKIKKQYDLVSKENKKIEDSNRKKKPGEKKEVLRPLPNINLLPYPDLKKLNMHGDPHAYWINTVKAGAAMKQNQTCNYCQLENFPALKSDVTSEVTLSDMSPNDTVFDYISNQFEGVTAGQKCPNSTCPPEAVLLRSAFSKATDSNNHWLINVDLASMQETHSQKFKENLVKGEINSTLLLDDAIYKLGSVQFNQGNHFFTWHYDPKSGHMVHFDSNANKDKDKSRFRIATMGEIADATPYSMQYFRTQYDYEPLSPMGPPSPDFFDASPPHI